MNASKLDEREILDALEPLDALHTIPDGLEIVDEGASFYVSIGDVVAEKYRIEGVLGAGGMGVVLSAKHVSLDERFALKFLNEELLREEVVIQRFTQEARAACRIRSEHVCRVYDVGVFRGAPFLVMEHLEGRDLSTIVSERGPLRLDEAVEYTMQACEALADAHRQGIVHRDIKPENLFLVEAEGGLPSIKVLDFGISKSVLTGGETPSRLTGQLTLGTPCYMSPEQIRSTASADALSDLWSLGAVLYELLAGVEAFRAPTVTGVCAAVLEGEPESLIELRPEVPAGLAAVVARCLAKDPADRYENVAELAQALLPFAPARALVSVERSSSLMRSAARASGARVRHVTSVRPSKAKTTPSRAVALATDPGPLSGAPMWRTVDTGELPVTRASRRGPLFALAGAALALAAVAAFTFAGRQSPMREDVAAARPAPTEAALPIEAPVLPAASAPVAARVTEAPAEAPTDAPARAVGVAVNAGAKRAPAAAPRTRASASAAGEPSAAPAHASASASGRALPSAPAATPTVELGY